MSVIDEARAKIKGRGLKLVMPEGEDERIRAAAEKLAAMDLAQPVVFTSAIPEPGAAHIALVTARREKMTGRHGGPAAARSRSIAQLPWWR